MEDLRCEKLSIRDSAKSLKKYGSTSKHVTRSQNYVKHIISSTDTLQGIALKYGVTTEQIRRSNRLWATDSLFLREFLMIPVSDSNGLPAGSECEVPRSPSDLTSSSNSIDEDLSTFLIKIDNSIANTKEEVKKVQNSSEFAASFEHNSNVERRKPAVSRKKQLVNNNSFSDTVSGTPTVVMSHGRNLRSSLQRLEQQQDEIFEL